MLPLCVDLDGTLIKEDVTWKSVFLLIKKHPWKIGLLPLWLLRGRAYLKSCLGHRVTFDPQLLTYNDALLTLINTEKRQGRFVVLATAADATIAKTVADYLGCFDEVLATDIHTNLRATKKAQALCERFGEEQFIYVGNSKDDLKVAERAAAFILISESCRLKARTRCLKKTQNHCLTFNQTIREDDKKKVFPIS